MEKTRKLLDGTYSKEYDSPITVTIYTKCPGKWKLIDMETGQEYLATRDIENPNLDILTAIKNGLSPSINIHYGSWIKFNRRNELKEAE